MFLLRIITWLWRLPQRRREYQQWIEDLDRTSAIRKHVGERMQLLYDRYYGMSPTAIINELVAMHRYDHMPIYWFIGRFEILSYPILKYVGAHPDLNQEDALRLAEMLLWPEVRRFRNDASCRLAILGACERFPTIEVRAVLREHYQFAKGELEYERKGYWTDQWFGTEYVLTRPAGGAGTHLFADLGNEVSRTAQLVYE